MARAHGGFTLVEMMVAVSILAVLAASAAPAMTDFVAAQRVKTVAADLHASLLRTRSEAIKRNASVVLAPTSTWAGGWSVAADGTAFDAHEPTNNVTISGPPLVTYGGLGRPTVSQLAFTVTSNSTRTARCVQISLSGQPVVTKTACA